MIAMIFAGSFVRIKEFRQIVMGGLYKGLEIAHLTNSPSLSTVFKTSSAKGAC